MGGPRRQGMPNFYFERHTGKPSSAATRVEGSPHAWGGLVAPLAQEPGGEACLHCEYLPCTSIHPSVRPSIYPSIHPFIQSYLVHRVTSSIDVREHSSNTPHQPVPSHQPAYPALPHAGRARRPSRWIHQPSRAARPTHSGWGSHKVGPAPGRGYPKGFGRFDPPRRQAAVEGQGSGRSVRHLGHGCGLKHARPIICRLVPVPVVRCTPLGRSRGLEVHRWHR
jgi:hypothetical protein